ncbi:MAG: hypothetical protein ABR986_02485 [Methanomassiliicoccales archaeon]|jgi:hypothetical protein
MSGTIGYGEDALTLWALNNRREEFLKILGDTSNPSDCILFYRPSFGRGGRSKACLGEFDSILISPLNMYLIETKWDYSPEIRTGELVACQDIRHASITWLARNWEDNMSFSSFFKNNRLRFSKEFPGKELAPEGSGVYQRMEFILETARQKSKGNKIQVKNVILLMLEKGSTGTFRKIPSGFELVTIHYDPIGESNFFVMD